ncbi:MAG: response regulator [Dehalococcoidia bacterium]|nr:response regulator [Dehalococcoidia bacterium]
MESCAVKGQGVLLVDDQPECLDLWESLLEGSSAFRVMGRAGNWAEAMDLLQRSAVQVVVLDVNMPGVTGFEVAQRMLALQPGLRVVLVSAAAEPEYATIAKEIGAVGFLAKREFSVAALRRLAPG